MSVAVSLRVADYYTQGSRWFFRLHEKGGRYNVVPAHHTAQAYSTPTSRPPASAKTTAAALSVPKLRAQAARCAPEIA